MRIFMAAVLTAVFVIATLMTPTLAAGGRHHGNTDQKTDQSKSKADDKAYESTLSQIPDQNRGIDPWRNMREPTKTNGATPAR